MYFSFSNPQNFVRTLTHGVTLSDTRIIKTDFFRTATQTARGTDLLKGSVSFIRRCVFNVANAIKLTRTPVFIRNPKDQTGLTDVLNNNRGINRVFIETIRVNEEQKREHVFTRELKQNLEVTDNRKHTADYKRETKQIANCNISVNTEISFFRKCLITTANITGFSRIFDFFRSVSDNAKTSEGVKHNREINRIFEDAVITDDDMKRSQGFIRSIVNNIKANDDNSYSIIFLRTLNETQRITDIFQMGWDYIRCLYVEAGSIAETDKHGNIYRTEKDIVQTEGSVLRQLFIFIKIISTSLVRDFILRRFLIAREELVLKSCITRELTLDSKIN